MRQTLIVRSTRDFTVGPAREVVIPSDRYRVVNVDEDGYFYTHTSRTGSFFGMCKVGDGWEAMPQ